jgi:argininosuccinate lyase
MARPLWSGRFDTEPDKRFLEFSSSFPVDVRLLPYEARQSIAHARMLGRCGIIPPEAADGLVEALTKLWEQWKSSPPQPTSQVEDVHSFVEDALFQIVPEYAGYLHAGRSRNDQIATDLRMLLREACGAIDGSMRGLQSVLLDRAEEHIGDLCPGYTHLQRAQPVTLGMHLLAWVHGLARDRVRFRNARDAADLCPLGSAALAGTGLPIDAEMVAAELGFSRVAPNPMDAVSDRDFALDFLNAAAALMVRLSRMSEELILWSTSEFGYVTLADAVSTGSSIMPQKCNPDGPELVRAKTGRVLGDLGALAVLLKGLPLTYNRDLQEDKGPVFDAIDTVMGCLDVMTSAYRGATYNTDRLRAASGGFALATQAADRLVMQGVPFRTAHEIIATIVRKCIDEGLNLDAVTETHIRAWLADAPADPATILSALSDLLPTVESRLLDAARADLASARENL